MKGYILNKITSVKIESIQKQLEADKKEHAKQGMYFEYLWTNANNPKEIFFLFRVDNLDHCKKNIEKVYAAARKQNPNIILPEKIFLQEYKQGK
ncbi:hypothetical protein HYT52_03460 [Candidatus Woesearchaeota archaeon]|nr:hypothetical protein [Candidatus Woesearchaeota archaeon]